MTHHADTDAVVKDDEKDIGWKAFQIAATYLGNSKMMRFRIGFDPFDGFRNFFPEVLGQSIRYRSLVGIRLL